MGKQKRGNADEGSTAMTTMDTDDMATALGISSGVTEAIGAFKRTDIQQLIAEGFSSEQVVSLKDGDEIHGVFEGKGGDVFTTDPKTGERRALMTWRFRPVGVPSGLVLNVIGAAQLDSRLAGVPEGGEVKVRRVGQTKTNRGMYCNVYAIFAKPARVVGDARVVK